MTLLPLHVRKTALSSLFGQVKCCVTGHDLTLLDIWVYIQGTILFWSPVFRAVYTTCDCSKNNMNRSHQFTLVKVLA